MLYVFCRSKRHSSATKRKLSFCCVTQDGDEEGCLRLYQLPSTQQAAVIRDALGLRKPQEISDKRREQLRVRVATWKGLSPQRNGKLGTAGGKINPLRPFLPREEPTILARKVAPRPTAATIAGLRASNDSATLEAALQHHHIFSRRRFLRACLAARLAARLCRRRSRLSAAVAASALSGTPTSIAAAAPPRIATRNLRLV